MCWVIKLCVGAIGAIGLLAYSLFWASSFLDALMLNDCHRMVDALSYNHSGTIYHLGPIETLRVEPTLASCVATELFSDRLGLPSIGAGSSPILSRRGDPWERRRDYGRQDRGAPGGGK